MSDLVGNPEDRFSRVAAHMSHGGYRGIPIFLIFDPIQQGSNMYPQSMF